VVGKKHSGSGMGARTRAASEQGSGGLQQHVRILTMSRRKKHVLIDSSSDDAEVPGAAAGAVAFALRPRGRIRKAGDVGVSAAESEPGSAAAAAAAAAAPAQLVTPTRPVPKRAPPQESPREGAQRGRTQQKLRDRGTRSAAKQRQQRALQRLCSGRGGVNDLDEGTFALLRFHAPTLWLQSFRCRTLRSEHINMHRGPALLTLTTPRLPKISLLPPIADSVSGVSASSSEEEPKPAWGRLPWPCPQRQLSSAGPGGELEDDLDDEEDENEEEEAVDWDEDLGDFVVEDAGSAEAAFAEL